MSELKAQVSEQKAQLTNLQTEAGERTAAKAALTEELAVEKKSRETEASELRK